MEFVTFNDWDEIQRYMQAQYDIAEQMVVPRQRDITWGSYWVRPNDGILIWGRVWTEAELVLNEDDPEAVLAHYRATHERGYRFGYAYSPYCSDGELGESHISVLWPITRQEFSSALRCKWQPTDQAWFHDMLLRIIQEGKSS